MNKRLKRKNNEFSCEWLFNLFGENPDFEAVKVGSNVIEIRLSKLNDLAFREGGAIRLIANILVDSNGKVHLTSVVKRKDNTICYRISTSVK